MIKTKFFVCVWLIAMLFLSVSVAYGQENIPHIELKASQTALEKGDVVDVEVWLADSEDIYGGQLSLVYDANQLEVIPSLEGTVLTHGSYFGLDPSQRYVLAENVDVASGQINYAVVLLGDVPSISGSGQLFSLQLRMIGEGFTTIEIVDSKLGTRELEEIFPTADKLVFNSMPEEIMLTPLVSSWPFLGVLLGLILMLLGLGLLVWRRKLRRVCI